MLIALKERAVVIAEISTITISCHCVQIRRLLQGSATNIKLWRQGQHCQINNLIVLHVG